MTTISLTFEDGLSPALADMIRRAQDLTPAMQAIADHLEMATRRRFETGEGPDGKPWRPSLRATGRDANADGSAGKTLVRRGHLLASIDRTFGPDSATVGTNVPYARPMQFGDDQLRQIRAHMRRIRTPPPAGKKKPGKREVSVRAHSQQRNTPARPFIGIDENDRAAIFEILRDHLTGERP